MIGSFEDNATTHCSGLRFLEVGSGRIPVVLLHGLFGSPSNWQSIMDDLADRCRFLALQLSIDFGEDRRHTSFHSVGQLTDHVANFFDEVGLESAVLCGNSLGGHVALDFCLRHPQRVESLVLTGSAGLFERSLSGGKKLRLSRDGQSPMRSCRAARNMRTRYQEDQNENV